ncbi:uncharacterized protein LOC132304660 [Cornus florida]|uniref:uncharacterized protein LOC132304660 n=1 Tax=Cornus florida TaxID=4283 RepID=UPI00289C0194|nr:uncharacterized protein LOC132304660 [Cornus florida]
MGSLMNLCFALLLSCLVVLCSCDDDLSTSNAISLSTVGCPKTKLKPYGWIYIRVDLPSWYSSVSISLQSDVNIDIESIGKHPSKKLPIICFRDGGPPLPDVSNDSLKSLVLDHFFKNGSAEDIQYLQNVGHCYPLQKKITLTMTNELIAAGVLYFGIFNGIGPIRTQKKMINRGSAHTFSSNITIVGCPDSTKTGEFCSKTVYDLVCGYYDINEFSRNEQVASQMMDQTVGDVVSCKNSLEASCFELMEQKLYSLNFGETAEKLIIMVKSSKFDQTAFINYTMEASGISLMCYARYSALPTPTLHDYSSNLSKGPLVIPLPKVGTWYFIIQPVNQPNLYGGGVEEKSNFCYSLEWDVLQCPLSKAGPNCNWKRYKLQADSKYNQAVSDDYILTGEDRVMELAKFTLEPLLSNFSYGDKSDVAWTYFFLDNPPGAAGKTIHIQLVSDTKISYEIYARFGGLPSLYNWDYYYSSKTSNSNNGSMFKLYDSNERRVDFYILYAREGTWNFGLRHPIHIGAPLNPRTTMHISIENCPNRCSGHGTCQSQNGTTGFFLYSYCLCDRFHGGFDCSVEIFPQAVQRCESIFLIASNAAALFPAFRAFSKKAYLEAIVFAFSGISSALYHACDVGLWCSFSFQVLQFTDFWISFLAVVSTFLYLPTIGNIAKWTILSIAGMITAFMAAVEPTRSINIVIVLALGALVLVVGWLIEFFGTIELQSYSLSSSLNNLPRQRNLKAWFKKLMRTLCERFHWGYVLLGSISLSVAVTSREVETSQNYWIWHR